MPDYTSIHSGTTIDSAVSQITDSSTDLNIDSGLLFIDKSLNRVGVLKTDPQRTFHLKNATFMVEKSGQGEVASFTETQGSVDVNHDAYILVGGYYNQAQDNTIISPLQMGYRNLTTRIGYFKLKGGSDAFTIDATGLTTFAGDVDVTKASNAVLTLKATASGTGARLKLKSASNDSTYIAFDDNDDTALAQIFSHGSAFTTTALRKALEFKTGGSTTALILDASQNAIFQQHVTTSGTYSFRSYAVGTYGATNTEALELFADSSGGHIEHVVGGTGTSRSLSFRVGGTNALTLDEAQNATFDGQMLVNNKRTNLRLDSSQTAPNKLSTVLMIKGYDGATGDKYSGIGFNYGSSGDVQPPVWIGIQGTSNAGHSKADIVFATRSVTTDTAPIERMRISTDGLTTFAGNVYLGDGAVGTGSKLIRIESAGGDDASIRLMEGITDTYGFSLIYDGGGNQFSIKGHDASAGGTSHLTIERDNGNATFGGTIEATSSIKCGTTFKSSGGSSGLNECVEFEDVNSQIHTIEIEDGLVTVWDIQT